MTKSFIEEAVSGVRSDIATLSTVLLSAQLGFTATQIMSTINVSTGVTKTGTIISLGGWSVNNVYLSLSSSAVLAAASGVTVTLYGRGASGGSWTTIITNSNYDFSGRGALFPVRGSGTDMSGAYYFGDLKVEVFNGSSSGTALVNAYIMQQR